MSNSKPAFDPKELLPLAIGLCLGVGLLVFFVLLAVVLGMPTIVEHGNIPYS